MKDDENKIEYPCTMCQARDHCHKDAGCQKWKKWFSAVWQIIRDQYGIDFK